ncbi:hypothetical protein HA402_002451 [Bradysia odoriphaga]|nr:hypothetical protein HA402_002451 [Bradysia odoriphaga]
MGFLRTQRLCLYLIGFSFKKDESRVIQLYSLLSWISILIIIIPETHFVIENLTDIPLATDALCTQFTSMLSLMKIATLYFKKDTFYRIIDQLDDMWRKSSKSDRLILEEGNTIDKRLTMVYLVSSMLVAVLYLLFPIVKGMYDLFTTGAAEWIMPMRSIFIYDILGSPNYELTYLWFVQCTGLAVFGSVGVDCLFYGSSLNISSHFKIIQKKARNIKFDQLMVKRNARYTTNRVATEEFFDLIKQHQKILNICDEFETMYSTILFVQFLTTSAQLCVIAFQLTLPNQQLIMMATFVLFLSAICFQLFTYCHAGSQLTAESLAVAEAIYDSNWSEATPLIRKLIAFFLMRSQKSVIISSGFYVANLETYNAVCEQSTSVS